MITYTYNARLPEHTRTLTMLFILFDDHLNANATYNETGGFYAATLGWASSGVVNWQKKI